MVAYPTPINRNWTCEWGSLAGVLLMSQLVTGIVLAMHYVPHVHFAFASVQHLMTDVPSGMILRYAHANGASLATSIPVVGKQIVFWLWGGFSVDNPTLNRFYSFHYSLPFELAWV